MCPTGLDLQTPKLTTTTRSPLPQILRRFFFAAATVVLLLNHRQRRIQISNVDYTNLFVIKLILFYSPSTTPSGGGSWSGESEILAGEKAFELEVTVMSGGSDGGGGGGGGKAHDLVAAFDLTNAADLGRQRIGLMVFLIGFSWEDHVLD